MYRLLFVLLLRRLSAETAHALGFALIRIATAVPPLRWVLGKLLAVGDPALRSTVLGVDFAAPLGLAAGFDKDARGVDAWGALGFGCVEVGTVTAHAQPGNPKPRMFRLPEDRAVINRMGFNNQGSAAAAGRLLSRHGALPVGVNIGKTKVVAAEDAAADYVHSARLLAPLADYLVVNVSSPNTPGLRDLQAVESLRPLLRAVLEVVSVPVLVKIAPDLSDADVDAVADLSVELGLAGIVATNTTISRAGLRSDAAEVEALGAGGLSGAPLAHRSLEVLRRLHARVGTELVLVSVGGIETAEDAWERITAGASLVQGYTGFIYGGPFWARNIHRGLGRKLRQAGFTNIAQAVGSASG
ncbi:MAG: quinone-dependent dihydroorotate dehydrogenase [Mycobacteriaceae bacterium]